MEKRKIVHQIYKHIPPDSEELIVEVDDSSLAEFKVMQLTAQLTADEKEKGVFHYHWIRFDES
jgi:hypothetical protein